MTLLFCDGFDHYTSITDKWNGGIANFYAGEGRFGTSAFRLGDSNASAVKNIGVNASTIIVGMSIRFTYFGTVDPFRVACFRDNGAMQLGFYVSSSGFPVIWAGSTLWTGTIPFVIGVTQYIEMKATIHNSTGTVELRSQGVVLASLTGQNTRGGTSNNYANEFHIGPAGQANHSVYVDDLYVCDTAGSVNNDFLGDVRVQSIFPSGAGNTTQMTPSAGSNYTCVDETTPNGDTDYVSETAAGEKDTYAFGNLTPTSGTIKGVQVLINARKDDAGFRTIAPVYRPASTDYDGSTVNVGDSYVYYSEITEVSPETSSAWTIAEVNGAEFGVKLIA
jgi:hypothetical protein